MFIPVIWLAIKTAFENDDTRLALIEQSFLSFIRCELLRGCEAEQCHSSLLDCDKNIALVSSFGSVEDSDISRLFLPYEINIKMHQHLAGGALWGLLHDDDIIDRDVNLGQTSRLGIKIVQRTAECSLDIFVAAFEILAAGRQQRTDNGA